MHEVHPQGETQDASSQPAQRARIGLSRFESMERRLRLLALRASVAATRLG